MKHVITDLEREYLAGMKCGLESLQEVEIDRDRYGQIFEEVLRHHTGYGINMLGAGAHALARYCYEKYGPQTKPQPVEESKPVAHSNAPAPVVCPDYTLILRAIAILLFLLLCVNIAKAQKPASQIMTIKTYNGGSPLFTHAAPFSINCGDGMTCSDDGSVFNLGATGVGGTVYNQTVANAGTSLTQRSVINFKGGLTCSDDNVNLRTDCQLTASAAEANKFVTGVAADGSLLRAQPAFSNFDGTATDAQIPNNITIDLATAATALGTGADRTKLDGIAAGAEVNVNADWNAGSGDAQILNKPNLVDSSAEVVGLFGSGSCSGYLKSDGSCDTPSGSGGATWGSITGTLADQTDLNTALSGKAASNASTTVNGVACALGSTCTVADSTKAPATSGTSILKGDGSGGTAAAVQSDVLTLIGSGIASSHITDGTVATADVVAALKTRQFTFVLGADNGSALADTDDQADIWVNDLGSGITITQVKCYSDAGTPSINLQRNDGSAANILSSNVSCSTSGAAGTIDTAEDNVANGDRINFVMGTAGGTAKRVTVTVRYTVD